MKAGRLYEALQDEEEPDNFEVELQVEIENLMSEENNTVQKQSELLAEIMLKIKKPQAKYDKSMGNKEMLKLIDLFNRQPKEKTKGIETAEEVERTDQERSIKLNSLKILLHIYQNKWINAKLNPILHYEKRHAEIATLLKDPKSEMLSKKDSNSFSGSSGKVACVVELRETFENFKQVVDMKQYKELYEPIIDLILVYSQSNYKETECFINLIIPMFMTILEDLKEHSSEDLATA